MSTFVLIHGAWHGAWCWYKIASRLEHAGHRVIAPDLPSLGIDRTPIAQISLDSWTEFVCEILRNESEPVILVGHSRAGVLISQAAERVPGKVKTLVYLAAILLPNGASLFEAFQDDESSKLLPNVVLADDQSSTFMRKEAIKEVFYNECSDDDVALASMLLAPEAVGPSATPIRISEEFFGSIPRVYVECTLDNAIPLYLQRKMCSRLPCQRIFTIESDHSPFFSAPDILVNQLHSLSVSTT